MQVRFAESKADKERRRMGGDAMGGPPHGGMGGGMMGGMGVGGGPGGYGGGPAGGMGGMGGGPPRGRAGDVGPEGANIFIYNLPFELTQEELVQTF